MSNVLEIIHACVQLFAGTGVFLFGMRTMSKGLEKSAGRSIRKMFNRISNNRLTGAGIGTVATVILQSSSAFSVMVLGFVNAGLMSLSQATTLIMGANIGTTLTAFLYALQNFDIALYLMLFALVGVFMIMLDKKGNLSRIGECFVGVGLIFIGLEFMGGSFKDLVVVKEALTKLFLIINNPFLLVFVGVVVTAMLQSSSLVTAIIILLANRNAIPIVSAYYIVLGSNIGTCFTAIIASIGTSTNTKRTAFIHIFFNILGNIIFLIFMLPFEQAFVKFFALLGGNNAGMQIAFFHLIFNVFTTLILLPFVNQIVWVAEKVIKEKKSETAVQKLKFLDERIFNSPSLAIAQILKEIMAMAHLAETNLDLAMSGLINKTDENFGDIEKNEKQLNFLNKAITSYLVKISSLNISRKDEKLIGTLYHVVSDIERIGDHSENLMEAAQMLISNNGGLSEEAQKELINMYQKVKLLYRDALYVFDKRDVNMIKEVNRREEEIDNLKKEYTNNHIKRLHSGICSVESGEVFYEVTTNLERIADHLTNIAYSVRERNTQKAL
ncbi:MAG TPA: Na/Pi cotransporter family protein [Clostridia bacterium]